MFEGRDIEGKPSAGWSSLIGIVTAICGNILISVALNTQRYAHIRLHQRWLEQRKSVKAAQERAERAGRDTQGVSASRERRHPKPRRAKTVGDISKGLLVSPTDESAESAPLLQSYNGAAHNANGYGGAPHPSQDEQPDEVQRKSYLRSPLWWAGQVMMTVGEAGNFLAYGFAPASIVSPLGVVAIISNCIIAPFFLKEPFRKRDLLGVIIAVTGAVTVALSASNNNPKLGPNDIWKLIATWEFGTYLGLTSFAIIILTIASNRYGQTYIFFDLGLVGLFGGYTALSTKGIASLLSHTLFKALTFPVTYLLAVVLILTAVMQILYLNRALRRFDATQVIPTQFVLFTLSVILGSAVLYRDFERTSASDAGKFIGGCVLTFTGVYLITSARSREADEEEGFEEDEEVIRLAQNEPYHDEVERESVRRKPSPGSPTRTTISPGAALNARTTIQPVQPLIKQPRRELPPSVPTPLIDPSETINSNATPQLSSAYEHSSSSAETPWVSTEGMPARARHTVQKLLEPLSALWSAERNPNLSRNVLQSNSTPILPSEARLPTSRPETPRNQSVLSDQFKTPVGPSSADGMAFLSRHAISNFVPGPLTGTLSTPLSAFVADSLRRGVANWSPRRLKGTQSVNTPVNSRLRRRGNSDSDVPPFGAQDTLQGLQPDGLPNGSGFRANDENGATWEDGEASRSRIRSLSNTFADLFRRTRPVSDPLIGEFQAREPDSPVEGSSQSPN